MDLELDKVVIVYPGDKRYTLADQVEVLPLKELVKQEMNVDDLFT